MKTFTIIESEWARGGKGGISALLNEDGNKCCLGFLCLARGMKEADIEGVSLPSYCEHLPEDLCSQMKMFSDQGLFLEERIAQANDDKDITERKRKALLAPLFDSIGWEPIYVP